MSFLSETMLRPALFALAVLAVGAVAMAPRGGRAEDLDEGKSPAQLFASSCGACHKSTRGIVKSVSPSGLPGFLREHYTTGRAQAAALAAYVLGAGGTAAVEERPAKGRKGAGAAAASSGAGGAAPARTAVAPTEAPAEGAPADIIRPERAKKARPAKRAPAETVAQPSTLAAAPAHSVPPNAPMATSSPAAGGNDAPATTPSGGAATATPGQ